MYIRWSYNEINSRRTYIFVLLVLSLILLRRGYVVKKNESKLYFDNQDMDSDETFVQIVSEETEPGVSESDISAANQSKHLLFQSNVAAEFPTVEHGSVRIPHIIHQICDSEFVPDIFTDAMRSFVANNPKWEYRFWTYDTGRKMLRKRHPYLVKTYDSFGKNDVKKSDLLRFAVIYEYGGVYADLDTKNLRSLNISTIKYACILPTEPFEHAGILYGEGVIISTALLLCRPRHPFYKQLLLTLQLADPKGDPVDTTGPCFITNMYLRYNNLTKADVAKPVYNVTSNSPYFYKGERDEESDEGIYVPNSQYFMDNTDPILSEDGKLNACIKGPFDSSPLLVRRACAEFESRKLLRKKKTFAFTIHYWFHLWVRPLDSVDRTKRVHIKQVIPQAITY